MAAKNEMIRCINCKNGTFMQWFHNPIICLCNIFQEKFVAESRRICENYSERPQPLDRSTEVTSYDHY